MEVYTDKNGRIWGEFIRVRVEYPVNGLLKREIFSRELGDKELYILEVKYERAPCFYSCCGCIAHGDRNYRLPKNLKRVRFMAGTRASPYKP